MQIGDMRISPLIDGVVPVDTLDPTGTAGDSAPCSDVSVLSGTVVHGDHRGRLLGFPTANIALDEHSASPADGVWIATGRVAEWEPGKDLVRPVALSVGTNPTYGGRVRQVEAHLLDFDGDLYGMRLEVTVLRHLRATVAFTSEAELVAQIQRDVDAVRGNSC